MSDTSEKIFRILDELTDRERRLFACDAAERVAHLADDPRVTSAIEVARKLANGNATEEEHASAYDAVNSAHRQADGGAATCACLAAICCLYGDAKSAAQSASRAAIMAQASPFERDWQLGDAREYRYGNKADR